MHKYSRQLLLNAFNNNQSGWVKGALLKKFQFNVLPPVGASYPDFFQKWICEAKTIEKRIDKTGAFQEIYAFAYIYAITQLGQKEPSGPWIDWLTQDLRIPYPDSNPSYQYLEDGLKRLFKFNVPLDKNKKRLFVSGIGRQSGYFYEAYAQSYLRWYSTREFQERNWDAIIPGLGIPQSKIPRNQSELDYEAIWKTWEVLKLFQLSNRLIPEYVEDLAEALDVIPEMADRVINVFVAPAGQPVVSWIVPEIRLNQKNELLIIFEKEGYFPDLTSNTNVVIRVQGVSLLYRPDGDKWRLYGSHNEIKVDRESSLKIVMAYREGEENLAEKDITPPMVLNPVCVFKQTGNSLGNGSPLVSGEYYRIWRSGNWDDTFAVYLDDKRVVGETFQCGDNKEFQVRDKHGNIRQVYAVRCATSLQVDFSDENLAEYVAGKRTFSAFPKIEVMSVVGLDSMTLRHVASGRTYCPPQNSVLDRVVDMADLFCDVNDYGRFELTVKMGRQVGHRSFAILPPDFESNIGKRIPVGQGGNITFKSSHLVEKIITLDVGAGDTNINKDLYFDNGWILPVKSLISRSGAYVRIGTITQNLADNPEINLDDLYDDGEVVVYGPPDQGTSLAFLRKDDTRYLARRFPAEGVVSFSLQNVYEAVGGDFDYRYLTECNRLTVRLLKANFDFIRGGQASLIQYAAKAPEVAWNGNCLTFRHKISGRAMRDAPYIVLLPVTNQDIDKIPVIAPSASVLPEWAERLNVVLEWKDEANEVRVATLDGLSDKLTEPGYIMFVLAGTRRLSSGKYLSVPGALEPENDVGLAFLRVHTEPRRLENLFVTNKLAAPFISGVIENAKRLQGAEFLQSISSFDQASPSGYLFRNSQYWLPLMMDIEMGNSGSLVKVLAAHIELFNRFWDLSLFGYSELLKVLRQGEQLTFLMTNSSPALNWARELIRVVGGVARKGELVKFIEGIEGATPQLQETARALHVWRKEPALGASINLLRVRLKNANSMNPDVRTKIILQSLVYLLDDVEYLNRLKQEALQ